MTHIFPDLAQAAGSVLLPADLEPADAELDVIEQEMPLILAEVGLLDVQIALLDQRPTGVDRQRLRRASRRVLDARRDLATRRTAGGSEAA
ncbi:DUF6284 family protein [Streptomyces klenkii]|uniref:DUF6284 family protein n=1 Tax=Streptomyces klenkii TaxID=1420899 RepID=UPI0033B643D5